MHLSAQLGLLMLVATLVAMLCARARVPYTVGLVAAGVLLSWLPLGLTLQLSRELVFSLLLPPLVFEAALRLHWPALRRDLAVVVLLASVGVVLAAALTAAGMHWLAGWPAAAALLFGVLIAATDPVSVIATFREARVGGRLALLVESESLLNDGTAAVLFTAGLGLAQGAQDAPGVLAQLPLVLLLGVGGGIACGWLVGSGAVLLAGRSGDSLVAITLATLAAYGSFHVAEHVHGSGVLAAMVAGLVVGNSGRRLPLPEAGRAALESFWDYAAFVANSLIFLLIGRSLAQQPLAGLLWPALLAIALVTAGRAVAVYPLCAAFARGRLAVERAHQHVLFWGGLRGALALALALGLPEDLAGRDAVIAVTYAVVAFSIFVQGLAMGPLLRRLGQVPAAR
jgi:CPA1 family monovalent cation:H+ antiporter